jgi:hypothetical protein
MPEPFRRRFHHNLQYLATNAVSMEQIPSREDHSRSTSQENLLWNQKFHQRVHKSPPLAPVFSQMDPVHSPFLSSVRMSSTWCLVFMFSDPNFACISHLLHTIPRPSKTSLDRTLWRSCYKLWDSSHNFRSFTKQSRCWRRSWTRCHKVAFIWCLSAGNTCFFYCTPFHLFRVRSPRNGTVSNAAVCIYWFCMVLNINSNYFLKQR